MRFQYTKDDKGNISDVQHIPYPLLSIGMEREIYYEGFPKEIKISDDKKSFTVITQRINIR